MTIYLIGSSIIKKWRFPIECINLGINGLLTSELKESYKIDIKKSDSVVFYCGGNDIRSNISIDQIYNNIINFFSKIESKDVYIIEIVKCRKIYDMKLSFKTDLLNDLLKEFCNTHKYYCIDSNSIFKSCILENECKICKDDGIHIEDQGYYNLETLISNCNS
uniref:Uncharacterized protein n=1 Tax=viral metagenome TaxID=1070528 RepID=A0A6C0BC24_9ZZZZ